MGEGDWENARLHMKKHSKEDYLMRACEIQSTLFNSREHLGLIRMAENVVFKSNFVELSSYFGIFLQDMKDLFSE